METKKIKEEPAFLTSPLEGLQEPLLAEEDKQSQKAVKEELKAEKIKEEPVISTIRSEGKQKKRSLKDLKDSSKETGAIETNSDDEELSGHLKLKYLSGKCLMTRADGHKTGITLEDLIHKESLQKAILASYVVDKAWIESFLKPEVSVCLIENRGTSDFDGSRLIGPNFLVVHPKFESGGSMHAKLMLLAYPDFLRMVVGSANLVPHDWTCIENMVYVQDFPRKIVKKKKAKTESNLEEDLRHIFGQMSVPETTVNIIEDFDFTDAKVELVFSIPGDHFEMDGEYQGLEMLGSKVRGLFPTDHKIQKGSISYQTSALGNLTNEFISDFWSRIYPSLCRGSNFKVVFPSTETILTSHLGVAGAGTIFFNCRNYKKKTFPKEIFHDAISLQTGALSHSKIMIGSAQTSANDDSPGKEIGWFYCGSHNLSASAWGRASRDYMNDDYYQVSNLELGVVGLQSSVSFFSPFVFPPPAYKAGDTPFNQSDHADRRQYF